MTSPHPIAVPCRVPSPVGTASRSTRISSRRTGTVTWTFSVTTNLRSRARLTSRRSVRTRNRSSERVIASSVPRLTAEPASTADSVAGSPTLSCAVSAQNPAPPEPASCPASPPGPPHKVRPLPHDTWHLPAAHTEPLPHLLAHVPQFAVSSAVSTQFAPH